MSIASGSASGAGSSSSTATGVSRVPVPAVAALLVLLALLRCEDFEESLPVLRLPVFDRGPALRSAGGAVEGGGGQVQEASLNVLFHSSSLNLPLSDEGRVESGGSGGAFALPGRVESGGGGGGMLSLALPESGVYRPRLDPVRLAGDRRVPAVSVAK